MKNSKRWISILLVISILLNMHSVSLSTMAAENGETAQAAVSGETGSVSNEEIAEESEENASETGSEENFSEGDEEDSSVGNATSDGDENIDIEDDAEDQTVTEETDGTASELVQRKLTARAVRVSAWEKEEEQEEQAKKEEEEQEEEVKFFTDQMYWAENLWQWMFERQAKPEAEEEIELLDDPDLLKAVTLADGTTLLDQYVLLEDSTPLEVEISGRLPEDVEAVARYVDFDRSEDARSESALFAVDVTFYNTKTGEIYVPEKMEMLTVTLKGETVSTVVRDEKPLLAYANAPEERTKEVLEELESGYVSTVRVFTSGENVDPERLAYVAGKDGDRFYFQEDGEQVFTWDKTEEEPEKISFKTYALNTQMAPLRFVISAQQTEHTVTAESGDTEVSVTGAISEKVELNVADAGTAVNSTVDADDSDNATESGNAVESDSAADGESNAETVTETVVDVEVSMSYEGVENYVPDTPLTYKVENAAIGEAVENAGKVTVSVTDENAELVQVEDAVVDGDTVEFEAATVPGRITVTAKMNGEAIAPGQTTVTSTTAKNEEAEGDNTQNPKVSSLGIEIDNFYSYGTVTYKMVVTAEGNQDSNVVITDLTTEANSGLTFVSGGFTYTHAEGFESPEGGTDSTVTWGESGEHTGVTESDKVFSFPLTVSNMYDGDTITLTYVVKVTGSSWDKDSGKATITNTASITNEGNNLNNPDDDSVTNTTTVIYDPLTRELEDLEGSWAYWKVIVNPNGFTINGNSELTLADTFDDEILADAGQSIDYSSIEIEMDPSGNVTYDYSGYTGTFTIPDSTFVTITYRTRIEADAGSNVSFQGTAVIKDSNGDTIATSTKRVEDQVIYPSASDVADFGSNYMLKLYTYAEKQMQTGIAGAKFILMDADKNPLQYKVGDNADQPVTFTTGDNGYVNVELHEEDGDVSIEKNTAYYLEMIQAPKGCQKDNTLYGFMITDNPDYNSGGVYTYYNGDTIKVRLYDATEGLRVTMRFSGNYELTEEQQNNVTAVLQKNDSEDSTVENWVDVESHPNSDAEYGAITFSEKLVAGTTYRVIQQNQKPWDLPENINLTSTYYCIIGSGEDSEQHSEPQEFTLTEGELAGGVTVVIDNRYEEPRLVITKMDKDTGETLPGAVFTVKKVDSDSDESNDEEITTFTTGEDGVVVVSGGSDFESEVLYYIVETKAPSTETGASTNYLLPLEEEKTYFYFCNDEYLIPYILANLPEGETAVNLTEKYMSLVVDNQKEKVTVPVMVTWQNNAWPTTVDRVVIGLYQSVDGGKAEKVIDADSGEAKTVTLTSSAPYNNTAFTKLPTRDGNKTIKYSIKEESIKATDGTDILSDYNQQDGISDSGVYVVRNKEATALTIKKEWYDTKGNKVDDASDQSDVTFDIYRTISVMSDEVRSDGITNEEMTDFVSNLEKVRDGIEDELTFGNNESWTKTIKDLDKYDDKGNPYYYYVLETVPSFGNEIYTITEATEDDNYKLHTVTIKNIVAPKTASLTVCKAELVGDPREESKEREFEFTLKLENSSHVIRSWKVYTDENNPDNDLVTDWKGEVTFNLKPEDEIKLSVPVGVTATITETLNPEYIEDASSKQVTDKDTVNGNIFKYDVNETEVTVTYTNTLHVICKVENSNDEVKPFESLKSALAYIRQDNSAYIDGVATIQMLEDYTMTAADAEAFSVATGENIALTTATTDTSEQFHFTTTRTKNTDTAIISRGSGVSGSMLKNGGTLTLQKIILDGVKGSYTSTEDGGIINNSGILNLKNGATLQNATSSGNGGAIYSAGTVYIENGASITGNKASSGSAIYLDGAARMNMNGGSISYNTGATDGAVVVNNISARINLSGNPVVYDNRNISNDQTNLYIGIPSVFVINVTDSLLAEAKIGVTNVEGYKEVGQQFATTTLGKTVNLNTFVNDAYGYRGKLKDGTTTSVVWNGLTLTINKVVEERGANENDTFTITIYSTSITKSVYSIEGTVDFTVTRKSSNKPGSIVLRNVTANQEINISPLPAGEYTVIETESNYTPSYSINDTESANTTFSLQENSTITVTNTRKLADVRLTKTMEDQLVGESTVDFGFTVKLLESDESAVGNFVLYEDNEDPLKNIVTDESGIATFTMSPSDVADAVNNFKAPVGATMTITETVNDSYGITVSAVTMPSDGSGSEISDADTENENIFVFTVEEEGADITFSNVRKMADIRLEKILKGKVSKTETFNFNITLQNADSTRPAGYVMYQDAEDESNNITTGTGENAGEASVSFSFGENESDKYITLTIPLGTKLMIEEETVTKEVDGASKEIYDTTVSVNGGNASAVTKHTFDPVAETDSSIIFTNSRKMRKITVSNTVNGYSGNLSAFTYTATVTDGDGDENDYDTDDGFTDGVQTFELSTGENKELTVPYGAELSISQNFVVGYDTTAKKGNTNLTVTTGNGLVSIPAFVINRGATIAFTNAQLIGLQIVNNTSSALSDVKIVVEYGKKIYKVEYDSAKKPVGQTALTTNSTSVTLSIEANSTILLEIQHKTDVTFAQAYTISGQTPSNGYYYTIKNEPSYHEFADPAYMRVYNQSSYTVKGKLRYSVTDSIVTFTAQPLVSFDSNGGVWTTEMEGYNDRDSNKKVYQLAVDKNTKVSAPAETDLIYPTGENIELIGWTTDSAFAMQGHTEADKTSDKLFNFANAITGPTTLYAVWMIDRNTHTVTVQNAVDTELTVNVTLSEVTIPEEGLQLDDDVSITTENNLATFTLAPNTIKNLAVPQNAKLVINTTSGVTAYSAVFTDGDTTANSFTIASVTYDGTVAFIGGICKITDETGSILYDSNGNPAVYSTLSEAFTAYSGILYSSATLPISTTPAAIKMLVDEYVLPNIHIFPGKTMKLTTADKADNDFPYAGIKMKASLVRDSSKYNGCLFKVEKSGAAVTLENIIIDGKNNACKPTCGSMFYVGGNNNVVLNIADGTVLCNQPFSNYTDKDSIGAVFIQQGTLNVNGGRFSNLYSYAGGAIYAQDSAKVNISGNKGSIKFENCKANESDGGAIWYGANRDLTINGGENLDEPGIIFNACKAESTDGDGGAIFINGNSKFAATVKGCEFTECSANVKGSDRFFGGGGITGSFVNGMTVSHCSFTDCDTMRSGGAIMARMVNDTDITIKDCTFENCNCRGQGGAVGIYQSAEGTQSETTLKMSTCTFNNCSSGTENGSGGAIQSYIPCMYLEDTDFSNCWAGKEGGAINNWFHSDDKMWYNSEMQIINCNFDNCRAEDRYQLYHKVHYGGAIATKVVTLYVDNSKFSDCVSTLKAGGAIHCSGKGNGTNKYDSNKNVSSSTTIVDSTFENCQAKTFGGALITSTEKLTINEGSKFINCNTTARTHAENKATEIYDCGDGGAIYHGKTASGDSTQKNMELNGCTITGCSARRNGGAAWTRAQTVTIKDCAIGGTGEGESCSAEDNGGGIYLCKNSSQNATISGRPTSIDSDTGETITADTITGCYATKGSAVYAEGNVTFSNTSITYNTCTNVDSGAIHGGTMYFEGDVKVENNTCSSDSVYDHDVLLSANNSQLINTNEVGLNREAHVGVYVTQDQLNGHGLVGTPFGTYSSASCLDRFFNDRDGELFGYRKSTTDKLIYWGDYICKITDKEGSTLIRSDGGDAIYQSLSAAFDDFSIVTGGDPVYVKMLVEDYAIRQDDAISNFPKGKNITLTTELETDKDNIPDGAYPYRGTKGTVCTISRTDTMNKSLFYLNDASTTFTLESITLDGRINKTAEQGNYRLIEANNGNLIVGGGTTMQFGYDSTGDGGGAIYLTLEGKAHLEIGSTKAGNVLFENCTSKGWGGGAISIRNYDSLNDASFSITSEEFDDGTHSTTIFRNCTARRSGAIYLQNKKITAVIEDAVFENCSGTVEEGGAINHDYSSQTDSAITLNRCEFNNCSANATTPQYALGGAVYSKGAQLTIGSCTFTNCSSMANGGAIYHDHTNGTLKIDDTTFDGCGTSLTSTNYSKGGSVYSKAKTIRVENSSFENSTSLNSGGALYCDNNNNSSVTTISETEFDTCSVSGKSSYGGAIYSTNKTVTLQNSEITECIAKGSEGKSGAIYMDTSGSALNISGETVIKNCYANQGGAIYLKNDVTMTISDYTVGDQTYSPEFTRNGYTTIDGTVYNAEKGACIYLVEGSKLNISGSPKFSHNNITNQGNNSQEKVTNGGITDYVRQDIYLAGYSDKIEATSIHVAGELNGDTIWVWPEQSPHRLANEQFATTESTISASSLEKFRNALDDVTYTGCRYGEYLVGMRRTDKDSTLVYWNKVYSVEFMKTDSKDSTLGVAGATFSFYENVGNAENEKKPLFTATSADGTTNYTDDQGNTLQKGRVSFSAVPIGIYFMREKVPDGYVENSTTYLALVGTPSLHNNDMWNDSDGPLSVVNALENVVFYTETRGLFIGIFPLDSAGKISFDSGNLIQTGISNVRKDYEAYFMKKDSSGVLPGAEFSIYTQIADEDGKLQAYENGYPMLTEWKRDTEDEQATATSADGTNNYKKSNGETVPKGMVYFRELPVGTYYIKETGYPDRNGRYRKTFYVESDRVFKLVVNGETGFTLSEWNVSGEYTELSKDSDGRYVISNTEAVCKLTDNNDNLLYYVGYDGETHLPAIYTTLEEGFEAAAGGTLVDKEGNTVASEDLNPALKLKVLKDSDLSSSVTWDNTRNLTVTTAERSATDTDRYIFTTTRTSNTSRAVISRNSEEDELIDLNNSGIELTLKNIEFDGNNFSGRAIQVTSGSLRILDNVSLTGFVMDKVTILNKDSNNGGAIRMESGTTLTINGGSNRTAEFSYNKSNNDGGAISLGENCTVTISNARFIGNEAEGNGGAICMTETTDSEPQNLPLTNAVFTGNIAGENGGALCTVSGANVTLSGGTTKSGTTHSNSAANGGAFYVETGATLTLLNDPTITNNTASKAGAGIYLKTGSTLNLSGNPYFGGSGVNANGSLSTTSGNFLDATLNKKYNGGVSYTKARQDIYIEEDYEYSNDNPASIQITGDLTGNEGTIWVWAESANHNYQFMPFAKPIDGVVFAEEPVDDQLDAEHLKVFRNAQDDATTGNATDTYLFGTLLEDWEGYVCWGGGEGVAHVMLVKVQQVKVQQSGTEQTGTTYQALQGKKFSVYRDTDKEKLAKGKVYDSETGELGDVVLEDLESGTGGAFFIGEMPYGTYYVFEDGASGYFPITVDKGGVVEIKNPGTDSEEIAPVKTVDLTTP